MDDVSCEGVTCHLVISAPANRASICGELDKRSVESKGSFLYKKIAQVK